MPVSTVGRWQQLHCNGTAEVPKQPSGAWFHYVPYNDIEAVETAITELDSGDYGAAIL